MTKKQYDIACQLLETCCACSDTIELLLDCLRDKNYSTDPVKQLAHLYLETLDLSEHGTSIRGSWPTPKGTEVLEAIDNESAIQCPRCDDYNLKSGECKGCGGDLHALLD